MAVDADFNLSTAQYVSCLLDVFYETLIEADVMHNDDMVCCVCIVVLCRKHDFLYYITLCITIITITLMTSLSAYCL